MKQEPLNNANKKEDFVGLLTNLQQALKHYSLKELNDAILSALEDKSDKKSVVTFVISSVSSVYKLTPITILDSATRGIVQEARMISYAILHYDLQMSLRYVGVTIFKRKNHNGVVSALRIFKDLKPEKFSLDREVIDKYKIVQKATLDYIINKKKQPIKR